MAVTPDSNAHLTSVAFSPDGNFVYTGSIGGTVRVWNARTFADTVLRQEEAHEMWPQKETYTAPNSVPAAGKTAGRPTAGPPISWSTWMDNRSFGALARFDRERSAAFLPDGKKLIVGSRNRIEILDARLGSEITSWPESSPSSFGWVTSVAVNRGGDQVVSGALDGTAQVWNLRGRLLLSLGEAGKWVSAVAFSPNGKLVAVASGDGKVRLWDSVSGRLLQSVLVADPVNSVAFSPDGNTIVIGSGDESDYQVADAGVQVWDWGLGRIVRKLRFTDSKPLAVVPIAVFSPNGDRIFASRYDDGTIWVWDVKSGRQIATLRGHSFFVHSLVFTPDGLRLFSGANNEAIRVWDANRYDQLLELSVGSGALALSPNGCRLISMPAKVWDAGHCDLDDAKLKRDAVSPHDP